MENILQWNSEKSTTSNADFFENLVRESARKLLAAALESEVEDFILKHQHKLDSAGHRDICPSARFRQPAGTSESGSRELMTVLFLIQSVLQAQFFRSSKTPTLENIIPTLYLKGISTNKFQDALTAFTAMPVLMIRSSVSL